MAVGDVSIHLLKIRLRHHILHWGLNPSSTPPLPRLTPRQPAGQPVTESSQHPLHTWRQEPCLWPVYQELLHCRQVNISQCQGIRSLHTKYPSQLRPLMSGMSEVAHHCQPFVVLCHKNSPHILGGGDLGEGEYIGNECPRRPFPCLLLRQATSLPLH